MEQNQVERNETEQIEMEQNQIGSKKSEKKLRYNIVVVLVMATILLFVGTIIGGAFMGVMYKVLKIDSNYKWIVDSYIPFIGIWIVVVIYSICTDRKLCKNYFQGSLKMNGKQIGLGLLSGCIMNGLCILIAFCCGGVQFKIGTISFVWVLIAFVVVWIQSGAEELLTRGYMYMHLNERYGWKLGMVVCSIYFSALHIFNGGITVLALINIAVLGLFYAISVKCFGNIWFVVANHTTWNFTQNFIFGLPNSGLVSETSILALKVSRKSLFYDTIFGVEGTIIATIVVSIAIVVLCYLNGRKGKNTLEIEHW